MTYTREQILELKPGKQLDMLINLHVFKYIPVGELNFWLHPQSFNCDPEKAEDWVQERPVGVEFRGKKYQQPVHTGNFGRDIAAAWGVIEHLRSRGIYISVETYVDFYRALPFRSGEMLISKAEVRNSNVSTAIAQCALLAVLGL